MEQKSRAELCQRGCAAFSLRSENQITVASTSVSDNATREMMVSHTVQVLKVCGTVILKYSLTSQKPPSLTCENTSEPAPVASTINSGRTPPSTRTMGATMPQAVVRPTITLDTPPSIRMRPKPAPAPTTSVILAVGARHSLVNLSIVARPKPRCLPKV